MLLEKLIWESDSGPVGLLLLQFSPQSGSPYSRIQLSNEFCTNRRRQANAPYDTTSTYRQHRHFVPAANSFFFLFIEQNWGCTAKAMCFEHTNHWRDGRHRSHPLPSLSDLAKPYKCRGGSSVDCRSSRLFAPVCWQAAVALTCHSLAETALA